MAEQNPLSLAPITTQSFGGEGTYIGKILNTQQFC